MKDAKSQRFGIDGFGVKDVERAFQRQGGPLLQFCGGGIKVEVAALIPDNDSQRAVRDNGQAVNRCGHLDDRRFAGAFVHEHLIYGFS